MSVGRAYNRDVSRRKALRKRRIDKEIQGHYSTKPYYDNLHQYSKNKVHCSCHMCSSKTNNKGKRRTMYGNYDPSYNPSAADRRTNDRMSYIESNDSNRYLTYRWYYIDKDIPEELLAAINKIIEIHNWSRFQFFFHNQKKLGLILPDLAYDCDNEKMYSLSEKVFSDITENYKEYITPEK